MSELRTSRTKITPRSLLLSSNGGDDEGFEIDDIGTSITASEDTTPFLFFKSEETDKKLREITNRVSQLFVIPPSAAELLLISMKWDYEKLETTFWENPERIRKAAGLLPTTEEPVATTSAAQTKQEECPICSTTESTEWFSLDCKHGPFCVKCWKQHVHQKITEGSFSFKCMQGGCSILMREEQILYVAQKEDFVKYRASISRNFVDSCPRLCWCPNPRSCDQVIEYRGIGKPDLIVNCPCGYSFCYSCRHVKHTPVQCELVRMWDEKSRDPDSQLSIDWLTSNTKPCPKCNHRIQKNEGCNHMTCKCGHEFCWLCRAPWSTHGSHTGGFYSCNKYETSDAKKEDDKQANTKKELDRYLHYYNRFYNYRRDLERGDEKRKFAALKTAEFKKDVSATRFGMSSNFMAEAVELELECRDVLSWTYVIAFFMEDGTRQKDFFTFLQANLEGITERLADMNKSKLSDQDDDQMKTRSRVTKKYLDAMSSAMEEEARTFLTSGQIHKTIHANSEPSTAH